MQGDRLASGARSATFSVAPKLKFDAEEMKRDLRRLTVDEFCDKYLVTKIERSLMLHDDVKVNDFAQEMQTKLDAIKRVEETDAAQQASLDRECFLEPIVGYSGRVIVSRDKPLLRKEQSNLVLPKSMRKQKEALPTSGRIIKGTIWDSSNGVIVTDQFIGRRVVFSPMSGTALCFNGFPTWIQLEVSELLAFINKEDAELIEEPLEPMV